MHPSINLDEIARQAIQPVQTFLAPSFTKPDKKLRTQWQDGFQLVDIGLPVHVNSPAIKKKFKILVQVYDSETKRSFTKTIFFGQQNDYIFTGDKNARLKKIMSLKQKNNPLHPDYWRAHLCLASPNFKENCKKMVDYMLQKRFPNDWSNVPNVTNQSNGVKKKQT